MHVQYLGVKASSHVSLQSASRGFQNQSPMSVLNKENGDVASKTSRSKSYNQLTKRRNEFLQLKAMFLRNTTIFVNNKIMYRLS
jgi:hypothetical protein